MIPYSYVLYFRSIFIIAPCKGHFWAKVEARLKVEECIYAPSFTSYIGSCGGGGVEGDQQPKNLKLNLSLTSGNACMFTKQLFFHTPNTLK